MFILRDSRDLIMITACLAFYVITVGSRIAIYEIRGNIGRFNLQHHKKLIIASTIFHIAMILTTVRTTIRESEDAKRIIGMIGSQLGLGIIWGISTTEFLVVLTGGFRSIEDDLRELNTAKTDSDPIIECNICLMEFSSSSRIPRILENCGHSICEQCADVLLKQRFNLRIACPICQTVTEVYGSASKLVTNPAVLEFVEGIKMK